jgi:hypothetical protein
VWRTSTSYSVEGSPSVRRSGAASNLALFAEQATQLGADVRVRGGGGVTLNDGDVFAPLHLEISWRPSERWAWSVSATRSHQFTQSLSNAESVARYVLPVDLPVAAGVDGVPVPRSDQVVIGGSFSPAPGISVSAEAFTRVLRDIVLVAPAETRPFATDSTVVGEGSARGGSVEVTGTGARLGWLAGYAWQQVTRRAPAAYEPMHGAAHTLGAGFLLHPAETWSLRVSLQALFGRSTSEVRGPFEWEACNLLDMGCEFAGAPEIGGDLGRTALPPYARTDVGLRKHWHVTVAGRGTVLGAFATVTNVLGRGNVLTYTRDGAGALTPIHMQPIGPLVVGIDWRY